MLDTSGLTERDCLQIKDRIAGYNPLVVRGEVLRKHRALPTACGASDEVGVLRYPVDLQASYAPGEP